MTDLKKYLRAMCKKIKSKNHRLSSYREISNHLQMQIEDLTDQGFNKESATQQVLMNATPPKKLGRQLNRAQSPWYIRHVVLLASGCLSFTCVLALLVSAIYITRTELLPALENYGSIPDHIAVMVELRVGASKFWVSF